MEHQIQDDREIWQPVHPSIRPLLDPQYLAFHDRYMQYVKPDQMKVWDGSARTNPSLPSGGSPLTKVAKTEDIQLSHCQVRAFTPLGKEPESGWPALLWFHGGGWTIGGLDSENDFCTYICSVTQCVVVTVDYRLAPEVKYPAPIEDAIEALQWISSEGSEKLHIDTSRLAVGGTSAGGNIAAVLAMKAPSMTPPVSFVHQVLLLPVIDNTADDKQIWVNVNAPWLTPARMLWYRRMYVAEDSWSEWGVSPNYAPMDLKAKSPATWIGVSEHDLLATEGLDFAGQLRDAGVEVTTKVYTGCTHSLLALNGVMEKGRQLMEDVARVLEKAFGNPVKS